MKLTVLVSSPQFLSSAGNRIRYQRLRQPLAKRGCALDVATIDAFKLESDIDGHDMFLLSKVQDARGLALAHDLRAKGCRVGVDLFDDYFSQTADARYAPQRLWIGQMAQVADFFLCSTERMKQIAARYFASTPGHVLNDPFVRFEPEILALNIEEKRQAALKRRIIDVLWFGMGDNPNFQVGLHDLTHYGAVLQGFRHQGWRINLKILTNLRSLGHLGLQMLRRLPVRPEIEIWSEAREEELLRECLISFLPVNAQGFSIAKSLNRAITALTGGTQIFAAGYPLYAPLDKFIYRDTNSILKDLNSGSLRVSSHTLASLGEALSKFSDPRIEAEELVKFMNSIDTKGGRGTNVSKKIAIVHGLRSSGAVHKFSLQHNWLSLGSPLTPAGLSYHAHFAVFERDGVPAIRLTKRAAELVSPQFSGLLRPIAKAREDHTYELQMKDIDQDIEALLVSLNAQQNPSARMVLRSRIDRVTRDMFSQLFGPLEFIDSELDPLICQLKELETSASCVPA